MDIQSIIDSENVFQTEIGGYKILWRLLSMREWRILSGLRDSGQITDEQACEEAFKRVYMGRYELLSTEMFAGVSNSIGRAALWMSGDNQSTIKQDIILARKYHPRYSVYEKMKRIVMIAFPGYTPDDLQNWSRVKLLEQFAAAEAMLIEKGFPYEAFNVDDIGKDVSSKPKHEHIRTEAENKAMEAAYHGQMEGSTFWEKTPTELSGKGKIKSKAKQQQENLSSRDLERLDRMTQN